LSFTYINTYNLTQYHVNKRVNLRVKPQVLKRIYGSPLSSVLVGVICQYVRYKHHDVKLIQQYQPIIYIMA